MRLLRGQAVGFARRAHSSLLADRPASGGAAVGDLVIAPGPDGLPYLCRITSIDVKRFCDVDASDAWLEGVDDRSLDAWVRQRAAVFAARAAELGIRFDERSEIVFERFSFVRPARADEGWSLFDDRRKFSG